MSSLATISEAPRRHPLPSRVVQLYAGLILYGISSSLLVLSGLGLEPWNVLNQGLARHSHIAIGTWQILVSVAVLLFWIPLRLRPGFGTISNAIVLGLVMNIVLGSVSAPHSLTARWTYMALGVVLNGIATGAYIGAGLGPGPRDGLMLGIAERSGRSIRRVRTALEATVLAIGFALGGTVGIGTLAYALAIGPLAHLFVPLFSRASRLPDVVAAEA